MYGYVDYTELCMTLGTDPSAPVSQWNKKSLTFDAKKRHSRSVWSSRPLRWTVSSSPFAFSCLYVESSRLLLVLRIHGRDFVFASHSWYDLMMFRGIQRFSVLTVHEFSLLCAPLLIQMNDSWPGAYFPSLLRLISVNMHEDWRAEFRSWLVNPHHVKLLIIAFNVRDVWRMIWIKMGLDCLAASRTVIKLASAYWKMGQISIATNGN